MYNKLHRAKDSDGHLWLVHPLTVHVIWQNLFKNKHV